MTPRPFPNANMLPKQSDAVPSGVPKRFIMFSAGVLGGAYVLYAGLSYGYTSFLEERIDELNGELSTLSAQLSPEERSELLRVYSQAANLQNILKDHVNGTSVFAFLEKNTQKNVKYTGINVVVPDRSISIEGVAASYDDIIKQLAIYKAAPEVERMVLEQSQTVGSVVNFRIVLTLREGILR